ncbi:MAG: hypothetical protein ABGX04_03625 [Myxococcales bacterium]|nr:hypothetical protein [Myxococcales bacterium]HIK86569.1 hypothetical protein [Myxococcales bacterium]
MSAEFATGLPRLELRIERLQLTFRFTLAFHAREIRFEVAQDGGSYERVFPETFSFHVARHDPTELFLQLEDLLNKSQILGPRASARDARNLMTRMLASAPRYLDGLCNHLEESNRLRKDARLRFHQDVALLSQILIRFNATHDLGDGRQLRLADYSLRRRMYESLRVLMSDRVDPEYVADYVAGRVQPVDESDDPSESGFFQIIETGETEAVNRMIVRMAERAFYLWLEGVCLDEENQAFEKEDSPFDDREAEVLSAISVSGANSIERSRDLMPFLRRSDRNCQRILGKLERWFLRIYDIEHSSAIIQHAATLAKGGSESDRVLTWHKPLFLVGLLGVMLAPFIVAAFAYDRAPRVFDILCTAEVLIINVTALWFLLFRFCWKRDLSFFHASVPRIGAGIIVGYLPVFLIDEVWDLASRPNLALDAVVLMLGLVTLLYIYVEIARRISDTAVAFSRARTIFLLGVVEAFGVGVAMTGLVGPFMVARNWSPTSGEVGVEALRESMSPMLGELPHIVGVGPIYAFPSALLLMTFLSFFIGIFLQLMWEELPITEPL